MKAKAITREQAIALSASGFWKTMTPREIAEFQMGVELLCMPFGVFHEAMEKTLGRPVWTHEFATDRDGLLRELYGDRGAPSLAQIINLLPKEKRVLLVVDDAPRAAGKEGE